MSLKQIQLALQPRYISEIKTNDFDYEYLLINNTLVVCFEDSIYSVWYNEIDMFNAIEYTEVIEFLNNYELAPII